ncbi:MAG: fimbrillin family protein [Bacteroidales bacterium]|nr:fimbrillin family protein [Bacteroidales bacterium]
MKKYLFFAAAALVAGAACAKIDRVDETAITFNVVNYVQQTKANTEFPKTETFGTFAWWTQTDWATDGQTNIFMDNQEVAYNTTDNVWAPTLPYFWTKTGKITFASYAPYTAAAGSNGFVNLPTHTVADGFLFTDYTVVNTTDVDLMYADLVTDQTKNTNPATYTAISGVAEGVPTLFHHALTQVAFVFKAGKNTNPNVIDQKIVLNEAKIINIYNKGNFTQNNASQWAGQNGSAAYEINAASNSIEMVWDAATPYTPSTVSRIVLPQDLASTGTQQSIYLSYTIKTKYKGTTDFADEVVTSTVPLYYDNTSIGGSKLVKWGINESILYTITINPYSDDPIYFDPAVVDWTVVNGAIEVNAID